MEQEAVYGPLEQALRNTEAQKGNYEEELINQLKACVDVASLYDEVHKTLIDDLNLAGTSLDVVLFDLDEYISRAKIKELLTHANQHGATFLFFMRKAKINLEQYPRVKDIVDEIQQELFYKLFNPLPPLADHPEIHITQALRLGLDANATDKQGRTIFHSVLIGAWMYRSRVLINLKRPVAERQYSDRTEKQTAGLANAYFSLLHPLVFRWGAKIDKPFPTRDEQDMTPFEFVLNTNIEPRTKESVEDLDLLKLLVKIRGAVPDGAVEFAQRQGRSEAVITFLSNPWPQAQPSVDREESAASRYEETQSLIK